MAFSMSDNCDGKNGLKFLWTIENFRFRSTKFLSSTFAGTCSEWVVELCFPAVELTKFSGILKLKHESETKFFKLFIDIFVIDDDGRKTSLYNSPRNFHPGTKVKFAGEIERGTNYPYDSIRLCFCMNLRYVTPALSVQNICRTVVEYETFQKIIELKPSELKKQADIVFFKPINEDLPELKFRISLTGNYKRRNIYLEMVKQGLVTESIIIYCKTYLLNYPNLECFTEDFFCYEANKSDNVRHIKNVFPNFLLEASHTNKTFKLLLELSVSTNKEINFMKVKNVPWDDNFPESSNQAVNPVSRTLFSNVPKFSVGLIEVIPIAEKTANGQERKLMDDVLIMYNEKKYSDLTICAEGHSFLVHKTILQACLPVFATMLESNMMEKLSGTIKIKDARPETIKNFLDFVYSDKLPDNSDSNTFLELYSMAEKYELLVLKQKCSKILKSKIDLLSACDILALADLHEDITLKDAASDFVKENYAVIVKTEQWKKFILSNVQLAAEMMHIFLTNPKVIII